MAKYLIVFILLFLTSCSASQIDVNDTYTEAKVMEVMSSLTLENKDSVENQSARILVKVTSGIDKDKEIVINQQLVPKLNDIPIPDQGDVVVLSETILSDGNTGLQIVDIKRRGVALFSLFLLLAVMSVIGGVKGIVFSVLLLSIFFSVNYILFPLISWGLSPVFFTFIGANLLSALIGFLVHSKEKIKAAFISNSVSLFVVTILAYIMSRYGALGSLLSRNSVSIVNQEINVGSLIASAIIIASLGVIININLTVFNSSKELKKSKPDNKDSVSTLINTVRPMMFINVLFVFLIYLGLGLPVLFSKYYFSSLSSTINTDIITFYFIANSISGIGIIVSAVVSSFMSFYAKSNDSSKKMRNIKSIQGLSK